MLLTDNKKEFYDVVVQARAHVLVFVSHELDSISAAKIIRFIFECDHIPHTIVPIRTKNELLRSYQEHRYNVKHILLINLCGTIDAYDLFIPDNDMKIFIADAHRPFNVHNVYYDNHIYLMCSINGINNIEDEFRVIPKYEELFWDSDIEDDDDDTDVRNLSLDQLEKRNRFKQFESKRNKLVNDYEEYSYYSYSVALIFFDLVWKLGKDTNELLWLTILAVVDRINCYKIKEVESKKEISYLFDSMVRLRNIRSDQGFVIPPQTNDGTQSELVMKTNHLTITYEKDLNLKLFREWSIYESLLHTMYISCKFKIWKFRGQRRLHLFLADIGIPLNECRQKFQSMDLDLRKSLLNLIEEKVEKYGISNIMGNCFMANRVLHHRYSCNDLAAASRALLESPDKCKRSNQKFYDSYDSLSWSNIDLIDSGLNLARQQLISISNQVRLFMDSHQIQLLNNVLLYVNVSEGTVDEVLFCHPVCLRLLSIYTLNAYASIHAKSGKNLRRPLVLITPDPERPGISIVCGISPLLAVKECKSFFHQAYGTVSRRLAKAIPDWTFEENLIDPDIIYIKYSDRMAFLNELSLLLETN